MAPARSGETVALSQAISQAVGLVYRPMTAKITRKVPGGKTVVIHVHLDDIIRHYRAEKDLVIRDGDAIAIFPIKFVGF